MKRTLSLFLSIIMVLSLLVFSVHAEDIYVVTPTENDYNVSNSTITGLKSAYINSLTDEQKQNIKLILPETIGGVAITGIGNNAFKYNSKNGYQIVYIDLSQMSGLKTIGEWAFYSNVDMKGNIVLPDTVENISTHAFDICPSLTGDLIIPNSVKTIGTYAFSGCTGLKGRLVLSNQLKVISNYAFKDAGFTGKLIIPSSVEKICDSAFRQGNPYNGFSGKLVIPNSVTTVEKVAFSYQDGITDVQFSDNMTTIPEAMFRYCKGFKGVLEIPNNIQSIGMNAFSETNFKTIYLPEMLNQNNPSFIIDSPFYNCPNLTAIICKEKDYNIIKPLLTKYSSVQNKLTYETKINLQDENNNSYNPLLKLYKYSYQYVKQNDNSWKLDTQFRLSTILGDNTGLKKWSITKGSQVPIYETSIVGLEKTLYAIEALINPTITYSKGIDKVYDGLPARLTVNATHPKYVDINHANEGDIVFYYTWKWSTIGSSPTIQAGFDLNTLDLTEVYNPTYAISCIVTIQTCYVEDNKAKVFYTTSNEFNVNITQADSIVNPVFKNVIQYKDGFPDIQLSKDDTKGTISWDTNQTLQEGTHSYKWTFTPEKNQVGSSNYTTVTGTAEITALNPKIFNIQVKDNGNGQVTPGYSYQIIQGGKTSLTLTPNKDYSISSVKLNGKECLSQLNNNVLTIENIQSNYLIEIKFEKINIDNVEHIIEALPKIPDNQKPTPEQVTSILEAKLSYENLGSLKDDISKETRKEFNELLMKLPQIEIETKSQIADNSALLDNMSIEDIEVLLNDPNATLSIHCDMTPVSNDSIKEDIKDYTNDMTVSNYFNIEMIKVLSSQGNDASTTLSNLKSPIQLVLEIPTNLPPISEKNQREYYIIRIHEENGIKEITVLDNESLDNSSIVVSTDKFSIYAIAYKDIDNSILPSLPEQPSYPILPEEPSYPIVPKQPIIIAPQLPNYSDNSSLNLEKIVTNDELNTTLWLVLGIGSLVIGIALIFIKKKK